jgi:transcriptional regulator PpsR
MTGIANDAAPRMRFSTPKAYFGALDPDSAGAIVAGAADVALVLSATGDVLDVAFSDAGLAKSAYRDWVGRRFSEIVTAESTTKIADLLRDAAPGRITRWRQVNHPVGDGPDVPVRYATIRLAEGRNVLAVGRDLRALAASQARLMEQTQTMEREYARIRDAEKRYRLLFQMTSEASLVVDAGTHRVLEANPAASALFGLETKRTGAGAFEDLFASASRPAAQSFLAAARVAPRIDNVHVELARDGAAVLLSGSLFRQDAATLVIVLISRLAGAGRGSRPEDGRRLALLEAMPEAFVVTDHERRIVSANAAFVDLIQVASESQTRGEPLDRWIGRQGVDLDVLYANLKTHGVVRRFSTLSRGEFGTSEDVEIAAASALDGTQTYYGFNIRRTGEGAGLDRLGGRELPRTVEQFADLVGRVPLKNLVRETTDLIERLCIEAALELTKDNRASAAEMLGLSRQGFYAKLRRYGLGDLDGEEDRPEKDY